MRIDMEKIRTEPSGRKTKVVSVFVEINKHLTVSSVVFRSLFDLPS